MAIAGRGRLSADIELHRSAETAAAVGLVGTHGLSACFVGFLASVPDGRRKFDSAAWPPSGNRPASSRRSRIDGMACDAVIRAIVLRKRGLLATARACQMAARVEAAS